MTFPAVSCRSCNCHVWALNHLFISLIQTYLTISHKIGLPDTCLHAVLQRHKSADGVARNVYRQTPDLIHGISQQISEYASVLRGNAGPHQISERMIALVVPEQDIMEINELLYVYPSESVSRNSWEMLRKRTLHSMTVLSAYIMEMKRQVSGASTSGVCQRQCQGAWAPVESAFHLCLHRMVLAKTNY